MPNDIKVEGFSRPPFPLNGFPWVPDLSANNPVKGTTTPSLQPSSEGFPTTLKGAASLLSTRIAEVRAPTTAGGEPPKLEGNVFLENFVLTGYKRIIEALDKSKPPAGSREARNLAQKLQSELAYIDRLAQGYLSGKVPPPEGSRLTRKEVGDISQLLSGEIDKLRVSSASTPSVVPGDGSVSPTPGK